MASNNIQVHFSTFFGEIKKLRLLIWHIVRLSAVGALHFVIFFGLADEAVWATCRAVKQRPWLLFFNPPKLTKLC